MKTLLFFLFATFVSTINCVAQKEISIQSIATEQEYSAMDATEKKLVNYVNASIGALKCANLHETTKKQMATISLSLKGGILDNNIVISDYENVPESAQSCLICGVGSGLKCFRKIRTQLGNGPIVVTVELNGDCVHVSW